VSCLTNRPDLKTTHPDDVEFIAFPCYQFGYGESETEQETQTFRATNYGVSFTILRKIDVNGEMASPLYQWMKSEMPGFMCSRRVKWNFEKFVIDRYGRGVRRFASELRPELLKPVILKALQA
jgi:glutathione peroxidase